MKTVAEVSVWLIGQDLEKFLSLRSPVEQTDDPEAVHDMRVAARRMREAIRCFSVFLPLGLATLGPELQWIFQSLGAVRDLDIALPKLAEDGELLEGAGSMRSDAKTQLVAGLNSSRFQAMVDALQRNLGGVDTWPSIGAVPILAVAPDLTRDRHKGLLKAGDHLDTPELVHGFRKKAKRLRYTLEFFRDIYGRPSEKLIASLKELQDVLGERQDDLIVRDIVARLSPGHPLTDQLEEKAEELTERIGPFLAVLNSGKWDKLSRKMNRLRREMWRSRN